MKQVVLPKDAGSRSEESDGERFVRAIEGVTVHDHLCLIYKNKKEQFAAAIPFMHIGLARGEKCIYIADDNTAEEVFAAMRADGIEVDTYVKRGALSVIGKREAYLRNGYFDPDEMIEFLKESTAQAKKEGYAALRATGEMTWMLGGEPGTDRLIEYEAKLNRFFLKNDCLALCQYNYDRFRPEVLVDVIHTHPIVVVGNTVCKNFYYVPVEEFLKAGKGTAAEVDRLLGNLIDREHVGAEREKWEEERRVNLQFLEALDLVNRAIQGTRDLDQMMKNVLDAVLSVFDCDRAWLFYPCDPDAPSFRVPMEMTKPEYPGAGILNVDVPMPSDMAQNLRETLESDGPVTYAVGTERPVNKVSAEQFGVKSMMMVALYPKSSKPWVFGLHQCSSVRIWTSEDKKLLQEIGRRLADALTNLLISQKLVKKDRALRMLSDINQALIHATASDALLQTVCRIVTETGGYLMAWVGFKEEDEAKTVRPVAQAGFGTDYLTSASVTWANDARGRGPTGTAIRTGKTQIVRDIPNDPAMAPWRQAALERGYKSSVALPLSLEGKTFGTLNIYAAGTDAFTAEEIAILEELANDLAFGIISLRTNVEHKMLEEELLKASGDRYKALFVSSRDAVMTLEPPDWKFTSSNPATIKMFGARNEGDFLYHEPWVLSPKFQSDGRRSEEKAKEMIERAMREGSHFFEWTHKRLDGEEFPAEVLLSKVEQNGKTFLHALVRDITERKKLETQLKEYGEEKFKAIFDHSNDGVALADVETKHFSITNGAFCRMLGYRLEELRKLGVADIHPPEDLPYVLEQFDKQARGEIAVAKDLRVKRKDGSVFYADVNSSVVTIEGRKNLLGIFRDMTERKRAEEIILKSTTEMKEAQAIARVGSWNLDLRKNELTWSDESYRIFGIPLGEPMTYELFLSCVHPDDQAAVNAAWSAALNGEPYDFHHRIVFDGTIRWVRERAHVEFDANGGAVRGTGTVQDITDQKEAELEIQRRVAELERMNAVMVGRELKMIELKERIRALSGTAAEKKGKAKKR